MAVLDAAEHLVWENVHRISDGTPCRTFLALKTGLNLFPAGLNDFRQEGIVLLVYPYVWIHHLPLDPGWEDFPGSPEFLREREVQS